MSIFDLHSFLVVVLLAAVVPEFNAILFDGEAEARFVVVLAEEGGATLLVRGSLFNVDTPNEDPVDADVASFSARTAECKISVL
eukprot:gene1094-15426_t